LQPGLRFRIETPETFWNGGFDHREYFKEVSIETKTIVETIENAQGIDF